MAATVVITLDTTGPVLALVNQGVDQNGLLTVSYTLSESSVVTGVFRRADGLETPGLVGGSTLTFDTSGYAGRVTAEAIDLVGNLTVGVIEIGGREVVVSRTLGGSVYKPTKPYVLRPRRGLVW